MSRGLWWSPNGLILSGGLDGLDLFSASGGWKGLASESDQSQQQGPHGFPQFLPGGKRLLYFIQSANPAIQGLYAGSLDRPKHRVMVLATPDKALYVPQRDGGAEQGHLLFLRGDALMGQQFNSRSLTLEGEPVSVATGFGPSPSARSSFWVSDAGVLTYRTGVVQVTRKLTWMERDGTQTAAAPPDLYQSVRLSPDGKDVAFDAGNGVEDLWRYELARRQDPTDL